MSKKFTFSVAAIALFGAVIYASPYYAVYQMKQAEQRHDAQAFNDYVDFPALRQSLNATIDRKLQETMQQNQDNDLLNVVARGFANKLSAAMIESMVTPAGLAALMNGSKPAPGQPSAKKKSNDEAKNDNKDRKISYRYRDLNNFRLSISDGSDKQAVELNFERHGLINWKLNGLEF